MTFKYRIYINGVFHTTCPTEKGAKRWVTKLLQEGKNHISYSRYEDVCH